MLSNLEIAKSFASEIEELIIEAKQNGNIHTILDRAMEVKKGNIGNLTKILFSTGGPEVYIDLYYESGYIVANFDSRQVKKKIPDDIFRKIRFELEGLGYDC